jgi:hypothetical protein
LSLARFFVPEDASVSITAPPPKPFASDDDDRMLTATAVRAHYGDASAMWLDRMLKRPELGFPKPYYYGSRRMWKLGELRAFDRSRPREPSPSLLAASQTAIEKLRPGRPRKEPNPELRPLTLSPAEAAAAPPAAQPRTRRRRAPRAVPT